MYNKERKLIQKVCEQIYYSQLLCPNPRMFLVPLDIKVLVLNAWGRYVCMKKKTHHHLLCKGRI